MFDSDGFGIGLLPGESDERLRSEDQVVFDLTRRMLSDDEPGASRHLLPDEFEEIPVGPFLAAIVSSVDRSKLNGHDLVRLIKAEASLESAHAAGKLAAISELAFTPPGGTDSPVERSWEAAEYTSCELAAALTLTRRAAESQLDLALALSDRLSRVWKRFSAGDLDVFKTRELVRMLSHLDRETVDSVLDRVLDAASGLTTGQLRARIARLVLEADPDAAAHNMAEGLKDRKTVVHSNPDLTGTFSIMSAHPFAIFKANSYVDAIARSLMTEAETRTLDQLRADVALDLLSGACHCDQANSNGGGRVVIHTSLDTLAELSDTPGELGGYGPVVAEIARKTVFEGVDGEWTFLVTDNGRPVSTGTLSRRPTAAQRRMLHAVYPSCVFPGCRQPAYDCDLDHHQPVSQGGATHNDNLGPLCRHHHMARHHGPWQLQQNPGGDHTWTSPHGHKYTRQRAPPD